MRLLRSLVVLLLAWAQVCIAQSGDYFSTLDPAQIPTGLLLEKSPPLWRNFEDYNGLNSNPASATFIDWRQLLAEANNIEVYDNIVPTVEAASAALPAYKSWQEVHIGIINLDYNRLRPEAFTDTLLLEIDGTLHHNPNATESPYETHTLFAVAPDRAWVYSDQVDFVFDPAFLVSNKTSSFEVDFGDGNGFLPLTMGTTYSVSYNSRSQKKLRIRYFDNQKYYLAGTSVEAGLSAITRDLAAEDLPDEIITLPGGSIAGIRYGCQVGSIKKPVILVEGLDINASGLGVSGQGGLKCDDGTGTGNEIVIRHGDLGWDVFTIPEVAISSGNEQLVLLPELLDELKEKDYDIIILDFFDGADDIFDNAAELIALIEEVNARKALGSSSAENVIIGASMGGQVARVALKSMEQNGQDHDTRLYVSFDSPHQGANIPMGLQHFLDFNGNDECFAENNELAALLFSQLSRPAAQQLLTTHIDPAAAPVRASYVSALEALGYPEDCKNIAIASGSRTAQNQGYGPGAQIVDFEIFEAGILFHRQHFFAAGRADRKVFEAKVPKNTILLLEICTLLLLGGAIAALAFPATWALITVLGGFSLLVLCDQLAGTAPVPVDYCPAVVQLTAPGHIPLDHVAGGTREDFNLIKEELLKLAEQYGVTDDVVVNHERACFITAVSALDIQTSDPEFEYGSITDVQNPGSITPFDEIYEGQAENLLHVEVTEGLIDWFLVQLDKTDPDLLTDPPALTTLEAGEYYNYGTPYNIYMNSYQVNAGGSLRVNHPGATGFGSGPDAVGGTFEVYMGGCHEPVSVVVEEGGEFIIGKSGTSGIVHVSAGSVVHIKSGATLRVANASELEIAAGAKLVIEKGASIQLWDGQQPGGRARIKMHGSIEVGGEFSFSGNGYFDFHPGHTLSFTGEPVFAFSGMGKEFRFIRLSGAIVNLDLQNAFVHLENGAIEYTGGAVKAGSGSRIIMDKITFRSAFDTGPHGAGLMVEDPLQMTIRNSSFIGLEKGISITAFDPLPVPEFRLVENTDFTNCERGIETLFSNALTVQSSVFKAGPFSKRALSLVLTESVRLNYCEIKDYNSTINPGASEAIFIQSLPELVLSQSSISNCDVGIYAPAYAPSYNNTGDENTSNVFIRNQSVLADNTIAIDMQNGGISPDGVDYGLLVVDCSKLLRNEVAIKGRDVLLQMDAFENSGTSNPQFLRSNHFENNGALIMICYDDREIQEVRATGNYWGTDTDGTGIDPSTIIIPAYFYNSDCISGLHNFTFVTENHQEVEPVTCPPRPPVIDNEPIGTVKECEIVVGGGPTTELHDAYRNAYKVLDSKFENLESTEAARALFSGMAQVPDEVRNNSSAVCKTYIDVARVMSPGGGIQALNMAGFSSESNGRRIASPLQELELFPNPANDRFQINTFGIEYTIEIFDAYGLPYFKGNVSGSKALDTSLWPRGIYFVSQRGLGEQAIKRTHKLVLH